MIYVVCAFTGHFADDVTGHCATCAAPIVHRPDVPPDAAKVCGDCAALVLRSRPDVEIRVTEKTLREVALFMAKTSGIQ